MWLKLYVYFLLCMDIWWSMALGEMLLLSTSKVDGSKTERSSWWMPWSSLQTLKLAFNVSIYEQGSHRGDISIWENVCMLWSRCHKDHHKWKRSDSPCNTGSITVFRTRFKHMWPRAVKKVGRVIYIVFNWALMRMKRRPMVDIGNSS